jgi:hypothetical protein
VPGIRNALLRLDTETISVATAADGTTVDSAGSQEIGDAYESGGVPVAPTTAGEDDSRIVMDGLGVSMAPDQDEGHNSATEGAYSEMVVDGISEVSDADEILLPQQVTSSAVVQDPPLHLVALSDGLGVSMAPDQDEGHNSATTGAHSEVVFDGISEVADAGEILLPQQVTSSAVVQDPPLHLAALQPAFPPTIRPAIPTGSSHSNDDSELEGAQHGATTVSTPNTSTRAQEHSSVGETSIFATPGEVQPNRMGQLTTDFEDLHTELRLGLDQVGAQMTDHLQAPTDSTSKITTNDQTVQTVQEQAHAVKERVTKVEKVGESTRLRAAPIDDGFSKLDKKVLILERDRDISIEAERAFQESINEKVAVISGTHKSLTTSVNNCSQTLSTFKEVQSVKEAEAKKRMDDLQHCLQQTDLKVGDVLQTSNDVQSSIPSLPLSHDDRVLVQFTDGKWYTGNIHGDYPKTHLVLFDGYESHGASKIVFYQIKAYITVNAVFTSADQASLPQPVQITNTL